MDFKVGDVVTTPWHRDWGAGTIEEARPDSSWALVHFPGMPDAFIQGCKSWDEHVHQRRFWVAKADLRFVRHTEWIL